ncbi:mannose-1-phosphate guanyltransferase alpha-A-like isoform X6 [Dysidea avara]|uniref:mannose-1-phosphate guanyltransferase alpha-A-like isoform X6 n=1 Tax=Dysidea avara TaxID=196820 RepID=UPI00331A4D52
MIALNQETTNGMGFVIMGTKVLHYVEKPETYVSNIINVGAYLSSTEVFKHMAQAFNEHHKNELAFPKDSISLERNVLPGLVGTGKLHVYLLNQFWSQVSSQPFM